MHGILRRALFACVPMVCLSLAISGCTAQPAVDMPVAAMEDGVAAFLGNDDPAGQVRALLVYHDGEPVLQRYTRPTHGIPDP